MVDGVESRHAALQGKANPVLWLMAPRYRPVLALRSERDCATSRGSVRLHFQSTIDGDTTVNNVIELKPLRTAPENDIKLHVHCKQCFQEIPQDTSPKEWQELEIGWTEKGLQVWCKRHDINVVHIDFEGHQHPAI